MKHLIWITLMLLAVLVLGGREFPQFVIAQRQELLSGGRIARLDPR